MLNTGIKNIKTLLVTEADTAQRVGSGLLPVFSTPSMIALMEATASESVAEYLDAGMTTVGTHLDIAHLAADPVGVAVTCESELISVENDGRKLTFRVTVSDKDGAVGSGTHERYVVNAERFMKKASGKLENK